MTETGHTLEFSLEDFQKVVRKYRRELLLMPVLSCRETLKYMTGIPGVRGEEVFSSAESHAQFAPYDAHRKSATTTDIKSRILATFFGNVCEEFEPNKYIQTLLGEGATFMGDAQKQAPTAKLVIASVMKSLGEHLHNELFTAERKADGTTTHDLFNGWGTIATKEIDDGNISVANENLLELGEKITSANAVDAAKEIERSCHPILRRTEKFLFCDPEFYDAYCDNYLLTHSGLVYNDKYEQIFVEGSNKKTTLVPLDSLAGTDKYFVAPKSNMLYGYDNMSDIEKIEVLRTGHWVLSLGAAMFFGTQFRSIDKRFLKVVKLKADATETSVPPKGTGQEDGGGEEGQH